MSQVDTSSDFDVAIIGGGPAGLAAALTLGRACRHVLLCDAGIPRNAVATHIHNFVTRDGTPPSEFRAIGRAQLAPYTTVELRDAHVESIGGTRDDFEVQTSSGTVRARRVILCTGMLDEELALPGFSEAWGHSIFQCPYCHGWEVRGRRWGYLALDLDALQHGFATLLRSWTEDVVVFTNASLDVPSEIRDALQRSGVQLESRPVARLVVAGERLTHVELADGERVACEILYAHPPQRHVEVVQRLELALDGLGYVQVDPMTRQTSTPGLYAAGDLTTRAQGAIFAAATGAQAAAMVNHDLGASAPPR
ncbi:NAD(P)/FAD-dependent oxidoreductase [Paraliomyxa miuraensis]|uniref:NAD(P)/FAD-dependent oxidoreductase n=1 Tax=Paraliomyxa miuraensis TaxID=376150 RepID=UPI002256CD37|nr:NAD(P)/FAD-dependent oxidoreductase [Paraliomyxa miuraensis]MCX4245327.1 NAD(P)/FAD-dependent oxidoreductase [Paraliomyxa miuraensis]